MELIEADRETITLRLNIKEEFAVLLSMAMIVDSEFELLDSQRIQSSKDEVSRVTRDLFSISKQSR